MSDDLRQFAFAKDAVSQVITLSAGILTLSLTFSVNAPRPATDRVPAASTDHDMPSQAPLWPLWLSWILFLAAVLAGIMCLLSLTGLAHSKDNAETVDIYKWSFRGPWLAQVILFFLALISFVFYALAVLCVSQ